MHFGHFFENCIADFLLLIKAFDWRCNWSSKSRDNSIGDITSARTPAGTSAQPDTNWIAKKDNNKKDMEKIKGWP